MNSTTDPIAIGIDFGGTSVKLGAVQAGALIYHCESLPTLAYPSGEALLASILLAVDGLRARYPEVSAVGAGLPGIVDSRRGIVHHLTNVPGWEEVPLRELLSAHTGLPAVIENDANAMTYAEWKFGAGRNRENVVCVTLGTGVGGGLILGGLLYRGSTLGAGEIGNMTIDFRGVPGSYGNHGALEKYVGNQQIARRAALRYEAAGSPRDLAACTPFLLAEAARQGDEVAMQLWEETGEMLGAALADIVWLLNPDAIVLGGGVANAGELVFAPIHRTIRERTSTVLHERLEILPAELGHDAGLIGCGALALDALGLDASGL
jgi:glucokinase